MAKNNNVKKISRSRVWLWLVVLVPLFCTSCAKTYLDPKQIGRFRPTPVMNVILDSLGVVEEPKSAYSEAEDPMPEDLITFQDDYKFGAGDIIRIFIYELRQPGVEFIQDFTVTETGNISIPDIGLVNASGMTENELEDSIRDLLSPDIIVNPSVTVSLYQSERLTFVVNGDGARRPGRYSLPRKGDFRLMDAIAMAGSVAQFNVSNVYITRQITGREASLVPPAYEAPTDYSADGYDETDDMMDMLEDERENPTPNYNNGGVEILPYTPESNSSNDPDTQEVMEILSRAGSANPMITASEMVSSQDMSGNGTTTTASDSGRIEWVFENGKYVPVRVDAETSSNPMQQQKNYGPFEKVDSFDPLRESDPTRQKQVKSGPSDLDKYGWDQIGQGGLQTRVIRIPAEALLGGDPRYNIIIRPGDAISIPVDIIGEFEVLGNTNYQGAIDMTGRPINLKQAIALAGGLGELAWPKKVEVVRRIGQNKEVIVMVDLDKIAKGEQPDFFIKPFDLINVGTHGMSWHLYILRTAFRAYYGFGFTYDRNWSAKQIREDVSDNTFGLVPWGSGYE